MLGLNYIRNIYGLSMQELAEKLGISKQAISKWEKGEKKIPQSRIQQLSEEVFKGIPLDYYSKELNRIEQLVVQKNQIKTTDVLKVSYYTNQLVFNFEDPSMETRKPILGEEILDVEIKKEVTIEQFRLCIDPASPENYIPLKKGKIACKLLSDNNFNNLEKFIMDVMNTEDATLREQAEQWLYFFRVD